MALVYLALGSNVGDSKGNIENAIRLLKSQIADIKSAPVYTSKAIGYTDQTDFLNTVVTGQTSLKPKELLKFVKDIEQQVGRIKRFRWGPREIDIDIIFYDKDIIEEPGLTIPHPRFRERDFVLKPLCDINPKTLDPITKQTIQELLTKVSEKERSVIKKVTS
jgi:2-amino-4-hydroxy-6-hydroxymethyldihydropteridine diphosphokinase